jgi:CIC family chloride channel protein
MEAVARRGGIIRGRVAAAKALASAICIGSGGSAGPEGPIVQIGASLGSVIGQRSHASADTVRILVACGSAAGLAAIFNAPIAGVLFALEVILGDFGIASFAPVIIASVVSSVTARTLLGNNLAFTIPQYEMGSVWETPLYAILGILAALVARLFIVSLYRGEDLFSRLPMRRLLKPALGGLLLGLFGFVFPQTFADGYGPITSMLLGHGTIWFIAALVFAKIIATTITLGSGNSGGTFAPALFIGTALGATFGKFVNILSPGLTAPAGAYATVGMGAVLAAATFAPMTAMMMVFEMTRSYHLIVPLMLACIVATILSMRMSPESIYTRALRRRGILLHHGRDVNILARHTASEIMRTDTQSVSTDTMADKLLHLMEETGQSDFLVLDQEGRLVGLIGMQQIRSLLISHEALPLIVSADVMRPVREFLFPDDQLTEAWDLFRPDEVSVIPVVDRADRQRVVGTISRDSLTRFYERRLMDELGSSPRIV